MKIEHIAIWACDLEKLAEFYKTYFDARVSDLYTNEQKKFKSRFLTFTSGARVELMNTPAVQMSRSNPQAAGYAHLAFSVGGRDAVDVLTERLVSDGYQKTSGPRVTGDGYYESAILDPEGNTVEIIE